jgi:hypothetical protein
LLGAASARIKALAAGVRFFRRGTVNSMLRTALLALPILLASTMSIADESAEPVYELRIYTCLPGKLDALHARFRDHTTRLFEKHGMKNIGYWTPMDGDTTATTLIYVLEHKTRDAAVASWQAFRSDPDWIKVKEASEKDGEILAKPPESTFMTKTDYSPEVHFPASGRIAELRIYTASEGKLDALNARFRDHTDGLFKKHGLTPFAYWVSMDDPKSKNTLIYILEYDNREAAARAWKGFASDPDWQKAFRESQQNGSLTSTRPESVYMTLTDYSPKQ